MRSADKPKRKFFTLKRGALPPAMAIGFSILVAVFFSAIVLLKVGFIEIPLSLHGSEYFTGIDFTPITNLDLNEWGDFFAGVGGTLALVWLITSTVLQRDELAENRKELEKQNMELNNQTKALVEVGRAMSAQEDAMNKQVEFLSSQTDALPDQIAAFSEQADALRIQAEILEETRKTNLEDQAWHDIRDLLRAIRDRIPVNDDFYFWKIASRATSSTEVTNIEFCYRTDKPEELEKLSDISFLYRAGGALKTAVSPLKKSDKFYILEKKNGKRFFSEIKGLFRHIETLSENVSPHRQSLIQECRISDWSELLDVAMFSYEKMGKKDKSEAK